MQKGTLPRLAVLGTVACLVFAVFFADGYLQWVNSDTAGEAYSLTQDIRFPQGLFSENPFQPRTEGHVVSYYHSRVTGHILSYAAFNIVGPIYRELFHDPVNALYVSQGILSGAIFALLILVSAAYVSAAVPVHSWRYILSAGLLGLYAMALPPIAWLDSPFGMTVRFSHLAVTSNYVGTMVLALLVFFPYWRHLCTGHWHDFYDNVYLRAFFYLFLIAAVFSSTATTLWMTIAAGAVTTLLAWSRFKNKKEGEAGKEAFFSFLKDSRCHPLFLIMILGAIAVLAETSTYHGNTSLAKFDIYTYLTALFHFFISSTDTKYILAIYTAGFIFHFLFMKKNNSDEYQNKLIKIFPLLLFCNIAYVLIIGVPNRDYRFAGYNFGRDTIFPATWTMSLWLFSMLINFWREKKFVWVAPILIYVLVTNAFGFFTFPLANVRKTQKRIFERVHKLDTNLPLDRPLRLPSTGVAFNPGDCEIYTVPMLRQAGVISPRRKIIIVP